MLFVNRQEAGEKLAALLSNDPFVSAYANSRIVFSLIRGGAPVGNVVARSLNCPHYPLVSKKLTLPHRQELAIGALCENQVVFNKDVIDSLFISEKEVQTAKEEALNKANEYKKLIHKQIPSLQNKLAIIVDDGIATGATVEAACKYIQTLTPQAVVLAVPVAPTDFTDMVGCFNKLYIVHKANNLVSVGQFYNDFAQVKEKELSMYFSL